MKSRREIESNLLTQASRDTMVVYANGLHRNFITSRFHKELCRVIQEAIEGKRSKRLIVTAPRRHGKSMIVSETTPSWFLGKYPNKKVIMASHTQDLANALGGKVRDNMASSFHNSVFGDDGSVSPRASAGEFKTKAKGEFFAVGVGGAVIGHGWHLAIVDDPIKSREVANSPAERKKLIEWFSSAIVSAEEGEDGVIIVMHQRMHPEDLAGHLLEQDEGWELVNFPALIEDGEDQSIDFLRRDIGEPLVPELASREKLLRLKSTLLPEDWSSMFQQRPLTQGGTVFSESMLQRYESPPAHASHNCNIYMLVDPGGSNKVKTSKHDYTVIAVIGVGVDGNFYILDMVRDRIDLKERTELMFNMHRYWQPIGVFYEQVGVQSDLTYIRHLQETGNYRFQINEIGKSVKGGNAFAKKETRIKRLVPDMLNGRWYAPSEIIRVDFQGNKRDVIQDMIDEEMLSFPASKFDDAIDCISRIYDINYQVPNVTSFTGGGGRYGGRKKSSPW